MPTQPVGAILMSGVDVSSANSSLNSFGATTPSRSGTATRSTALRASPAPKLPQPPSAWPEPAAHRGRRQHHRRPYPGDRQSGIPADRASRSSSPGAGHHGTSPACPASSTSPPMREAVAELGGDPTEVNPWPPPNWSSTTRSSPTSSAVRTHSERNVEIEYQRNGERYQFLRWGRGAFGRLQGGPPGTGIVHQVNIEYLASVVMVRNGVAYPGHLRAPAATTMVNGLGVLGWGRRRHRSRRPQCWPAGLDAHPRRRASNSPARSSRATATDVVLNVTDMLRKHGVVGSSPEFCNRRADVAGQPRHPGQHEPRNSVPPRRCSRSTRSPSATCG